MDYVPSMAAVAAAAQKTHIDDLTPPETTKLVPAAATITLDPRPTYTLAPGTADAVLSLARTKVEAAETAEFETRYGHGARITQAATAAVSAPVVAPEPAKAASASNRTWIEDVRLDHIPTRKVGVDMIVQYDHPQVVAIWNAAFPNVAGRKQAGVLTGETVSRTQTGRVASDAELLLTEKKIYLLCSSNNYKLFSQDHPDTHIDWIAVDNEDILLLWPKDPGHERESGASEPRHVHDPRDPGA